VKPASMFLGHLFDTQRSGQDASAGGDS
jgi:hypothetical protein